MKHRYLYSLCAWLVACGLYGAIVRYYASPEAAPLVTGSWILFGKTWLFSSFLLSGTDYLFTLLQHFPLLNRQPIWLTCLIRPLLIMAIILLIVVLATYPPFVDPDVNQPPIVSRLQEQPQALALLLIYSSLCSIIIDLVRHGTHSIGAREISNLLFGKYIEPQIEDKLIMFVDLRNSMSHAEDMGTREFAHLLQDFFADLNHEAAKFGAKIHKYIGDEAILVWDVEPGVSLDNSLQLFFSLQQTIEAKSDIYLHKYGMVPEFKAGLNYGHITVTEIGDLKREIAYLSEAMHTTARLQSACNSVGEKLLVSREARDLLSSDNYRFKSLGEVELKGRRQAVEVYGVRLRE